MMVHISDYISEAVAKKSTGKYEPFANIDENCSIVSLANALSLAGATEVRYETIKPDKTVGMPRSDWYSALMFLVKFSDDNNTTSYSVCTGHNANDGIYIATVDGIAYTITFGKRGIECIERFEYNTHYDELKMTAVETGLAGVRRLIGEIKHSSERWT